MPVGVSSPSPDTAGWPSLSDATSGRDIRSVPRGVTDRDNLSRFGRVTAPICPPGVCAQ